MNKEDISFYREDVEITHEMLTQYIAMAKSENENGKQDIYLGNLEKFRTVLNNALTRNNKKSHLRLIK